MRYFFPLLFLLILNVTKSYSIENRLALLIGNSNYNSITSLTNPGNDVTAMAEILKDLGFEVLQYKDVSLTEFKMAIDNFGERLDKFDVGLFFYAGHGVQFNGTNYLIPIDARIESESDVEYNCIDAGRLLAKMESSKTKTNIIILDACRNNPFKTSWSRSISKDGLAFMEAPVGTIIAYSTAPGQTASDGDGKNGIYTECLLNKIGDPKLNTIQVFQEVRKMVRERTEGRQIPWESTSLENDFYFNQSFDEISYVKSIQEISTTDNDLNNKDIKEKINDTKSNKGYLWAEGSGENIGEADLIARNSINLSIIKLLYQNGITETGDIELNTLLRRHQSFCNELLNFVARRVYRQRKENIVFRYIPLEEINKQIIYKINKIESIHESGNEALNNLDLQDAMKYYFWAYVLQSELPGANSEYFNKSGIKTTVNKEILEEKINDIISRINATVTDSSLNRGSYSYKIVFYLDNKIMRSIGYRYWNGVSWSDLNTTNNGIGYVDLYPGYYSNDLKFNIEYKYPESARYDNYLFGILQNFNDNLFRGRSIVNPIINKNLKPVPIVKAGSDFAPVVKGFLAAVGEKSFARYSFLFTEEGLDIFKNLILYGNASSFSTDTIFQTFNTSDKVFLRGIYLKFKFPGSKTEFVENITLELTKKGLINNICFSLEPSAVNDILKQNRWPEENKWEIIKFLENYKTAYALKRIDFIDKIFSDRALIIVGSRVEESTRTDDNIYSLKGEKYRLTKLTKDQYIYRLRKVFDNNEFINIKFEDNIVRKRDNTSNVYGINIKQNYFSSSYADQGYLFLMVDLREDDNPVIYVRSWQPEKFDDGEVISLTDFTY